MSEQHNNDTSNVLSRQEQELDRAGRLEILNGLLNKLTDVLLHDLMGVLEISEDGDRIRLYAGVGAAQREVES